MNINPEDINFEEIPDRVEAVTEFEKMADIAEDLDGILSLPTNFIPFSFTDQEVQDIYHAALRHESKYPSIKNLLKELDVNPYRKNFILNNEEYAFMSSIVGIINSLTHRLKAVGAEKLYAYPQWLSAENFTEEMILVEARKLLNDTDIWEVLLDNESEIEKTKPGFELEKIRGELAILEEQFSDYIEKRN